MQQMDPQQQGQQTGEGAVESVKVEKNSRGYNWSYRVVKKPGQTWNDVMVELRMLEARLVSEYGG